MAAKGNKCCCCPECAVKHDVCCTCICSALCVTLSMRDTLCGEGAEPTPRTCRSLAVWDTDLKRWVGTFGPCGGTDPINFEIYLERDGDYCYMFLEIPDAGITGEDRLPYLLPEGRECLRLTATWGNVDVSAANGCDTAIGTVQAQCVERKKIDGECECLDKQNVPDPAEECCPVCCPEPIIPDPPAEPPEGYDPFDEIDDTDSVAKTLYMSITDNVGCSCASGLVVELKYGGETGYQNRWVGEALIELCEGQYPEGTQLWMMVVLECMGFAAGQVGYGLSVECYVTTTGERPVGEGFAPPGILGIQDPGGYCYPFQRNWTNFGMLNCCESESIEGIPTGIVDIEITE